MMRKSGLILAFVVLGTLPGRVAANLITYQYAVDNAFTLGAAAPNTLFNGTQTIFNVAPNSTTTINLFLIENLNGNPSSYINSQNGLFGAGASLNKTGGLGGATFVQTGATPGVTPNTAARPTGTGLPGGFGTSFFGAGPNTTTNIDFSEGENNPQTLGPQVITINGFTRVSLGTVQVQVGASGTTTFSIGPITNPKIGGNTLTEGVPPGGPTGGGGPQFDLDITNVAALNELISPRPRRESLGLFFHFISPRGPRRKMRSFPARARFGAHHLVRSRLAYAHADRANSLSNRISSAKAAQEKEWCSCACDSVGRRRVVCVI
jgi:hypothetical protein